MVIGHSHYVFTWRRRQSPDSGKKTQYEPSLLRALRRQAADRRCTRIKWITFATISVSVAFWPTDGAAHSCGQRAWDYSASNLGEARRRLKSDAIQTLNARVDCAEAIIKSPGLAGPFEECPLCAVEYAGLLADSAFYMRKAAEEAALTEKTKKTYLMKEVATRQTLHQFLSSDDQKNIRAKYADGNLLALADAMERVGMANEYNQLIGELVSTEAGKLQLQMYRVWIKAVRSCAVWDFRSADDLAALRKSLCNSNCIDDLKAVYAALEKANLVQPDGKVKTLMPRMPIPAECQQAPEPQ